MRQSLRGLIISLMLILVIGSVSVVVFAEDNVSNYGLYKPDGDEVYVSEMPEGNSGTGILRKGSLPSKYDGRTLSYSTLIKVKNQGTTGLCWACAASTCAERSWMQEQLNAGKTPSSITLSPMHLGYFLFNRQTDLLGNTAGDKNTIKNNRYTWKSVGGNNSMVILTYAQGTGAAYEKVAPFDEDLSYIEPFYCYNDALTLQNANFLYNEADIKRAIQQYGAAAVDFYSTGSYLGTDKKSYYCNTSHSTNHAVVIVGWDDNYSASNFSGSASGLPSRNGAWIIQNSWGTSRGESGYYYISYDDATLSDPVYYDMQSADTYDYLYQHDGNCLTSSINLKAGQKVANFYTASGSANEVLEAIGLITMNTKTNTNGVPDTYYYTVDIYTNTSSPSDFKAANKACSFNITSGAKGYNTYEIPSGKEVNLSKGTKYAICITYNRSALGETTSKIGYEQNNNTSEYITYSAVNGSGQSYWYGSSWYDLGANGGACARIKALTRDASTADFEGFETPVKVTLDVKTTKSVVTMFTPSDFTDKTVMWRSNDTSVATVDSKGNVTGKSPGATSVIAAPRRNLDYVQNIAIVVKEAKPALNKSMTGGGVDIYDGVIYLSNYTSGTLTATVDGTEKTVQVYTDNGNGYIYIDESWYGKSVSLVKKNSDSRCTSDTLSLSVGAKPTTMECLMRGSNIKRTYGSSRYDTSLALANNLYILNDKQKFDCIVVACGSNFPDALSGGYLAYKNNAPLITVDINHMESVYNYIQAKLKEGGKVYILGGEGAVSVNFENMISRGITTNVKRLAGASRYDTNIEILREAGVTSEELVVCSGAGFADALSASAIKRPILLVGSELTDVQKSYLAGLNGSKGYIIGGNGVVSDSVVNQVAAYGGYNNMERVAGQNRYETSARVAEKFFADASSLDIVVLSYGQNFPDGLSGGPVAMALNAPLILAETSTTGPASTFAKSKNIGKILVIGGPALISDNAARQIIN